MVKILSPPAALETPRTQSGFFFSISAERTENEKQQPYGQNSNELILLRLQKYKWNVHHTTKWLRICICRPLSGKCKKNVSAFSATLR